MRPLQQTSNGGWRGSTRKMPVAEHCGTNHWKTSRVGEADLLWADCTCNRGTASTGNTRPNMLEADDIGQMDLLPVLRNLRSPAVHCPAFVSPPPKSALGMGGYSIQSSAKRRLASLANRKLRRQVVSGCWSRHARAHASWRMSKGQTENADGETWRADANPVPCDWPLLKYSLCSAP